MIVGVYVVLEIMLVNGYEEFDVLVVVLVVLLLL